MGPRAVSFDALTWVAAFAALIFPPLPSERPMGVCEAIERADALSGQEVHVRGIWLFGSDAARDVIWSATRCEKPLIKDGWRWPDPITVEPPWRGDALQTQTPFADVYEQRNKLFHNAHEPTKILATFVGRLETKAHFKMDRRSVWPLAYGWSAVRVAVGEHVGDECERAAGGEHADVECLQ